MCDFVRRSERFGDRCYLAVVRRRNFFTVAGAAAAVTTVGLSRTAHAAASTPGCFPAAPWSSPFTNSKANAVLKVGTWNLIANGRIYTFEITAIGKAGVSANISSGTLHDVSWDPVAKKLEFTRRLPYQGGTTDQDFTGYLMNVNPDDPKLRIAGSVTREPTTNYDDPSRLVYGFYMTIDR